MELSKNFKEYFLTEMTPLLSPLEEKRKSIFLKIALIDTLILLFTGIGVYYTAITMLPFAMYAIIIGSVAAYILIKLNHYIHMKTSGYYNDFKKIVINSIVGFFGDKFSYDPEKYIAKSEYIESKIFKKYPYPKLYEGDDLIKGCRGKIKISLSEIWSSEEYTKIDYSMRRYPKEKVNVLIFKGLFFVTVFPKKFKQEFIATIPKGGLKKPCEFLPQETMKNIYKLSASRKMFISFRKNKMYVAVECKEDLFEPKISKSLLNYKNIEDYYSYLNFAVETSEDLLKDSGMWKSDKVEVEDIRLGYEEDIKCSACKKSLPEGLKFCIHCGEKVSS